MSLKVVRLIQRIIGVLLLVYGVYLIFGTQEFFGTLLIILAFLIFPSVNKEKSKSYSHSNDYYDNYDESSSSFDTSDDSNDSDGGNNH